MSIRNACDILHGLPSKIVVHPLYTDYRRVAGPYTSTHLSSNALTIAFDTCPKNAPDIAACNGFANAYDKSRVSRVGPVSSSGLGRGADADVRE